MGVQADIVFDYDGALALARRLWATAESFSAAAAVRRGARDEAISVWLGPFADSFASGRAPDEEASLANVIAGLETEALGWAVAWAGAVDDQNRIEWATAVEEEKSRRSNMEKFGDFFVGDDSSSQVPEPPAVTAPIAPRFEPTSGLVSYWHDGSDWRMSSRGEL